MTDNDHNALVKSVLNMST